MLQLYHITRQKSIYFSFQTEKNAQPSVAHLFFYALYILTIRFLLIIPVRNNHALVEENYSYGT